VYVIILLTCYIGATSVKKQLLPSIPMKIFKFKSIKDVIDGNFSPDLLVGKFEEWQIKF